MSHIENTASTKHRILSAAGELFADYGYHGTSLREITKKAGVNLAAINYHYKDKQALYCTVLAAHLTPINQKRLARLDSAEQTAAGGQVPLDRLLDLFFRPLFELGLDHNRGGNHFIKLVGRSMVEPLPFMPAFLVEEVHPVTTRFAQSLRRHVPQLPPEEFLWRLSFLMGAMHHTLATLHQMKLLTNGICRNNDYEVALQHLIQHAVTTLAIKTLRA